jgi:hypothetical protein
MTPHDFCRLALALPEALEGEHMGHPDFRIRGRIFASLWPDNRHAMVRLAPADQALFIERHPEVYSAAAGAWGRQGCTVVDLHRASLKLLRPAILAAWRLADSAPRRPTA